MKVRIGAAILIAFSWLTSLPAETKEPLWRFITGGRIRSYPAIGWDGSVYLLSDDRFLYALNSSGEQRWRYYLEERLTDCFALGYDGMIYIGYKTGELIAVHGFGRKVWEFDTGQRINFSPAIRTDGSVCLATDEGVMYAVHHTGSLLWKRPLPGTPAAGPAADVDNSLYVTLKEGELIALEPWGDIRWRLRLTGVPSAPAIGSDGVVYVGTSAGLLYAVDPLPKIRWSVSFQGSVFPPVIGSKETVYVSTAAGELAALSREGETLWTLPLGEIPSGPGVLGETGTIFVSTRSSTLYSVDPLGKIKWTTKVKGVLTYLSLSPQGVLYAGSSDWAIYAFPGEKPAASAWPSFRHDVAHSGASSRPHQADTIEERYAANPDFIYFQSLFLSGNADLMERGLKEVRLIASSAGIKEQRPYLLHLLRRMAGYTVVEEARGMKFPLRGFSEIRQEACRLYTELGGLEAYPLLLSLLKQDADFRMKAVAVRCLGRLESDRDGEAVNAMSRLIQAGAGGAPDNTFAQEVVIALKNISGYHGILPRDGVLALLAIKNGGYSTAVRELAGSALLELGKKP